MKNPLFNKLAALAAITLLLLFGLGLIEDVVRDRQRYRSMTAQGVANSLAGPQTLVGPMIHSACVESWDVATGQGEERRATEQRREFLLTAMPEQLTLQSGAAMQERSRGLHKVNTYNLKAHITAQWGSLASLQPQATVKGSRMQCGAPILMMAVGDARGIRTAQLTLGEQTLPLKPGTFHPTYSRGCTPRCPRPCATRPTASRPRWNSNWWAPSAWPWCPWAATPRSSWAAAGPIPRLRGVFCPPSAR